MGEIVYAILVFIIGYIIVFFSTIITGSIVPGLSVDFAINAVLFLCAIITYFSLRILTVLKKIASNDGVMYTELITYLISPDTFKTHISDEDLTVWLEGFYSALLKNFQIENVNELRFVKNARFRLYIKAIEKNNIIALQSVKIKLKSTVNKDEKVIKTFEVSYAYVNKTGKTFDLFDVYYIIYGDNKILDIDFKQNSVKFAKGIGSLTTG